MAIIKKGTLLNVRHSRKGNFVGIATKDFDQQKEIREDGFYPIALATEEGKPSGIVGMNPDNVWVAGDDIPCRASLCKIIPVHQREE